jgi:hypothetical protein
MGVGETPLGAMTTVMLPMGAMTVKMTTGTQWRRIVLLLLW